jgi:hypothetical protein
MTAALDALRANILTNSMTLGQCAALSQALAIVSPFFPTAEELSLSGPRVLIGTELALPAQWLASLFTIELEGDLSTMTAPYGQFFGISGAAGAPDYGATIPAAGAIPFPQAGPTSGGPTAPTAAGPSSWNLPFSGTYRVQFQVPITEANAELGLSLGGGILFNTPLCVAGRSSAGAQIVGDFFLTIASPQVLSIINPPAALAPLTVTPKAGGAKAASATLMIQRVS